jgi:hypothetical protein
MQVHKLWREPKKTAEAKGGVIEVEFAEAANVAEGLL